MREIIFRGKRVDNGKWVYGYYMEDGLNNHYIIEIKKNNDKDYHYGKTYRYVEIIPKTIGQFTGLYDKDKKPIYDGDIIDIHQTINGYNQFVIEYKDYGFSAKYYNQKENKAIRWYEYDLDELFDVNESDKEIELIGNIYDNKSLS